MARRDLRAGQVGHPSRAAAMVAYLAGGGMRVCRTEARQATGAEGTGTAAG